MDRHPVLAAALLVTFALASACGTAPPPPPVDVYGAPGDIGSLVGSWAGQFWGATDGHSGTLAFDLAADGTSATGEVLMQTADRTLDTSPGNPRPAGAALQTLAIRFIRVGSGAAVSGTLEPYRDPDCGCLLSTTFVGELRGDVLSGTYISHGGPGHAVVHGQWRAERKRQG